MTPLPEGALAFDLIQGNAAVAISLVELSGQLARHPLPDKARQGASNLRVIDAIVARVRWGITSQLKLATQRCIANDLRQLAPALSLGLPTLKASGIFASRGAWRVITRSAL
jgi:hypothetical protein